MAYDSLADFLEELADAGELLRVAAEVDAELEIAEITRRVAAENGPALLFENVRGSSRALVTNLLGSPRRVCRALAIESLDDISARAEALIEKHTPHNWFDRLKISTDEAGVNKFRPKIVKNGPCQQVVRLGRDVDLTTLGSVRQWPRESHPAITAAQLISVDPANDVRAVTTCPLQVLDANRLAIVDLGRSGLARHWSRYREAKQKMPVAAVLGGDPAGAIAASLELGDSVDFLHVEGLLRGKALEVVKCRTHALEVPARADLVIEGYVDPEAALATVESFVPGGSYYRPPSAALVLVVTAITERSHPIVPASIDCGPRGETAALALRASGCCCRRCNGSRPTSSTCTCRPMGGSNAGPWCRSTSAIRFMPGRWPARCGVRRRSCAWHFWFWSIGTSTYTTSPACWAKWGPTSSPSGT